MGLSLVELARRVGVTEQSLRRLEQGSVLPNARYKSALLETLGIGEHELDELSRTTRQGEEPNRSTPHVFLSHVREDAERVARLAADLEARGIRIWIDRHKIRPGERWERAIEDAIRSGTFFVACFSHAYAAKSSSYMNEELHLASKEVRRRPLRASWFLPLRLDGCAIPDWPIGPELSIRSFQWLDMFPDWTRAVERLAEVLRPSARSSTLVFIDGDWLLAAREAVVQVDFERLLVRLREEFGAEVAPWLQLSAGHRSARRLDQSRLQRLGYAVEVGKDPAGKAFDVGMALAGAALASSRFVLISGDGDLVPLIEYARAQGRQTVVIAGPHALPTRLKKAANCVLDLDQFIAGTGQKTGKRAQPDPP